MKSAKSNKTEANITESFNRHADPVRVPWQEDKDYPVVVHRAWTSRGRTKRRTTLKHHPLYEVSKFGGDYIAAQQVVEDLTDDCALQVLCDVIGDKKPVIVAPSLSKQDPKNVIPIWFAYNLAYQLDLNICREIFQEDKNHRTGRGGFYRLANNVSFCGTVRPGEHYLLADDVTTMGGTLAVLRSYIENNGGNVVGMTVLADSDIKARVQNRNGNESVALFQRIFTLKPEAEAVEALEKKHKGELSRFWEKFTGYTLSCLTSREVDFLNFFPDANSIKMAMFNEKNQGGGTRRWHTPKP